MSDERLTDKELLVQHYKERFSALIAHRGAYVALVRGDGGGLRYVQALEDVGRPLVKGLHKKTPLAFSQTMNGEELPMQVVTAIEEALRFMSWDDLCAIELDALMNAKCDSRGRMLRVQGYIPHKNKVVDKVAEEVEVALVIVNSSKTAEEDSGMTAEEEMEEEEKLVKRAIEASMNPEENCDAYSQAMRESKRLRSDETLTDKVWAMKPADRRVFFDMRK